MVARCFLSFTDYCFENTCGNGECIAAEGQDPPYTCECEDGYNGMNCDEIGRLSIDLYLLYDLFQYVWLLHL